MNALYQLSGSLWTMAVAIAFVLAARTLRPFEPKISISAQLPSNQQIPTSINSPDAHGNETSEDQAAQFLIMSGAWRSRRSISSLSAENGLVYWSNFSKIHAAMRMEHVYMLGSANRILARQLLSPIPSSGLIFAHLALDKISAL